MKKIIVYTVLGCILCSCRIIEKEPVFPDKPSREAYEGFIWEKIEQNGLKFWAQKNAQIQIQTNPAIPGAKIVWQDSPKSSRMVMRLFYLPHKKLKICWTFCLQTPVGLKLPNANFRKSLHTVLE